MPMSIEQHALLKLGEECNEVAQMTSKCSQFGMDEVYKTTQDSSYPPNVIRLHAELNDLMACIEVLNERHGLKYIPSPAAIASKIVKMDKFLKYSQELGMVEE